MSLSNGKRKQLLSERTSGLLLHITSLPGGYGCGDLGPEAYRFADFMQRAGQTFWQLLPLNPVSAVGGYSPYSSISAFAGNTMLISPEKLVEDGLLDSKTLRKFKSTSKSVADFKEATQTRELLFKEVFERFSNGPARFRREFDQFCNKEKFWLDDFALFVAIKQNLKDLPWYQWPDDLRKRNRSSIERFASDYSLEITKIKLLQFVFAKQWNELKKYCNGKGIFLFGDLPFYVSYDSADVWSHPEFFSVSREGRMEQVAGVPPDYFNADGQLWGMPVFRWNALQKNNFSWWVDRIRKNMELYDVLRLDHFRAFAAFWSVQSGEKTARNGKWVKAPGTALFETLRHELGPLPFIAEDLGDIDEHVHELRERFGMPGMKVLHFAFGDNCPTSDYIPHNYQNNFVVYTGTHDNNTTLGWFKKDIGRTELKNLQKYFGKVVSTETINTLLIRSAISSIAHTSIIPLQDILHLDHKARMNAPATTKGNWSWRMTKGLLTRKHEESLREMTEICGRLPRNSS